MLAKAAIIRTNGIGPFATEQRNAVKLTGAEICWSTSASSARCDVCQMTAMQPFMVHRLRR
eukprot:SAG31_NODE_256_length_19032_cov_5.305181_17_plen_61_part_00